MIPVVDEMDEVGHSPMGLDAARACAKVQYLSDAASPKPPMPILTV